MQDASADAVAWSPLTTGVLIAALVLGLGIPRVAGIGGIGGFILGVACVGVLIPLATLLILRRQSR